LVLLGTNIRMIMLILILLFWLINLIVGAYIFYSITQHYTNLLNAAARDCDFFKDKIYYATQQISKLKHLSNEFDILNISNWWVIAGLSILLFSVILAGCIFAYTMRLVQIETRVILGDDFDAKMTTIATCLQRIKDQLQGKADNVTAAFEVLKIATQALTDQKIELYHKYGIRFKEVEEVCKALKKKVMELDARIRKIRYPDVSINECVEVFNEKVAKMLIQELDVSRFLELVKRGLVRGLIAGQAIATINMGEIAGLAEMLPADPSSAFDEANPAPKYEQFTTTAQKTYTSFQGQLEKLAGTDDLLQGLTILSKESAYTLQQQLSTSPYPSPLELNIFGTDDDVPKELNEAICESEESD